MAEKTCLGIDIGNNRVKIAVKKGGVLQKVIVEQVPDGSVRDNHIVTFDAMGDFLRELLKNNRVTISNLNLSLPAHEVFTRHVTLPLMNVQQLKINLPYEFHDFISDEMDNYIYDYAVTPQAGKEDDGMLHLLACAVNRNLILNYQSMAKRARLRMRSITPGSAALNTILTAHFRSGDHNYAEHEYAILDLGDDSIKVHFFSKGTYQITRSMDINMNRLIQAVMDETGKDMHIARMTFEQNVSNIQSASYLEPIYSSIASQIMRVLNFYNFNNRNNTLEDLYYFGGGSLIPRLLDEIRETIPLELKSASCLVQNTDRIPEEDILLGLQAIGMTF